MSGVINYPDEGYDVVRNSAEAMGTPAWWSELSLDYTIDPDFQVGLNISTSLIEEPPRNTPQIDPNDHPY